MSIIGMTTSPEAFLAREAEMCYAVMAHVTDYDVWHTSEEPVTVEMVIEILHRNTQIAQDAVRHLANGLAAERSCDCGSALASALITDPGRISARNAPASGADHRQVFEVIAASPQTTAFMSIHHAIILHRTHPLHATTRSKAAC